MPPLTETQTRTYTVQEAAAETGLSEHTLRYYEKAHLIEPIHREGTGKHRRYSEENLRSVAFLRKLRTTGMSIREMQRFVALYRKGDSTLQERYAMLAEHRQNVLDQMEMMKAHVAVLDFKLRLYDTQGAERNWGDADCMTLLNSLNGDHTE